MGDFEFSGQHDDDSFIRAVANGQTNRHPFSNEPLSLSTTQSNELFKSEGLTSLTVSEILQGAGQFRPQEVAYDAFNQSVSGDLGHFIDSEGGIVGTLGARAPLLAGDILSGRRSQLSDGIFTGASGLPSGINSGIGDVTGLTTTPTPRPTRSGDIEPGTFPMDYGLQNGAIPEEYLVKLGIPENDTLPGAINEHMLWEPAAIDFLDMMDAMEADTNNALNRTMISETYRTLEKQQYFWNCMQTKQCNGGRGAAPVGTSNHGWGLAIDFGAAAEWIRANGQEFNWWWGDAPKESWHFTYNRFGI